MTRNKKPNELPRDIDDLPGSTRVLIVDHYLSKREVLRRLCQSHGIKGNITSGGLSPQETLVRILKAVDPDCERDVDALSTDLNKADVIADLGRVYRFPHRIDQSAILKSQAVHMLCVEMTGERPAPFELATDPALDAVVTDGDLPDSLPETLTNDPPGTAPAGGD